MASPIILSAVRCMYHKLGLLKYSQVSQENSQYENQIDPSSQKLSKQSHHLRCQLVNQSITQHFSTLMSLRPHDPRSRYFLGIFSTLGY